MVSQNVHASFLFFRCQSFIFKSGKSKCSYTARTRNTVKNYSILPCYHCITRPQLGLREGDNQRGEVIITSRENHHLAVILVANLAPCVYGYAQRHQTTTTRRSPGFRVWLRVTVCARVWSLVSCLLPSPWSGVGKVGRSSGVPAALLHDLLAILHQTF
jgi:hypothetical protein